MRTQVFSIICNGIERQARLTALLLAVIALPAMLTACDSDSPSVDDNYPPLDTTIIIEPPICPGDPDCPPVPPVGPTINTGVYIDSLVGNIAFATQSQSGRTTVDGEYLYIAGETVVFSIGGIDLPATLAKAVVTPLDLAGSSNINDTVVTNIVRLMLSLDVDGDPTNGIQISDDAHVQAAAEAISFSSPTFDTDVVNLVANSGSVTTALVDVAAAVQHLGDTLADFPEANAGDDSIVVSGVASNDFQLDGSASTDPQGRTLSYSWSIVSQPVCFIANCTAATLSNAGSIDAVLVGMRQPGNYVVELVANNGSSSNADRISVRLDKSSPTAGNMFGFALISFAALSLMIRRRAARREYLNKSTQEEGDK